MRTRNANGIKAQLIHRLWLFYDCGSEVEQKKLGEKAENAHLR